MSSDVTYTPPEGLPGPRELKNRTATALATLKTRGIGIAADPVTANQQIGGILRLLVFKGVISQPELEYFMALAHMEGIEGVVAATAIKPRLVLPGH